MTSRSERYGLALRALTLACVLVLNVPEPAAAQTADPPIVERVARLERALGSKALIELAEQIEALQQEVRQLRGDLENQSFVLEQLRKGQRDAYADADRRLGQMEQNRSGAAAIIVDPPLSTVDTPADVAVAGPPSDQTMAVDIQPAPVGPRLSNPSAAPPSMSGTADPWATVSPPSDANAASTDSPLPTSDEPLFATQSPPPGPGAPSMMPGTAGGDSPESEAAYRDAFGMLKAGQYEQSIAAFDDYLQRFPASQYADNAQYWLGEAYYVMRQYEPAIQQYQKLVANYPDSQKQSHAMLKIAYSYDKLGLTDQATAVLTQLQQKFPGSAAARLAEEQLQRLRAQSP